MTTHCNCTLAQRTVGDGCQSCNPKLALELAAERIAELELLADSLMRDVERWCLKASDLEAENARLLAEVARLQQNDARYQWLRKSTTGVRCGGEVLSCTPEELDESIDAALLRDSHGARVEDAPIVPGV